MSARGRNTPCLCGSGRKYKRCCLAEEERLARTAHLESAVGKAIYEWSASTYADELARAFHEFYPESRRVGEDEFARFVTWFNSERAVDGGRTAAERYAVRPDLDPREREVAVRIAAARLGLYRVHGFLPGRSIELTSLITGDRVSVTSPTVSHAVAQWDVLLCRVMSAEPAASLWGPVLTYLPDEERELLAELERLADEHGLARDPGGLTEACRVGSRQLLRFVPPSRIAEPSLFTAEGDPVVHARAAWTIANPEAVVDALDTPPELLWVGESEDGRGECFQLTGERAAVLAQRSPLPPGGLFFESSYEGHPDRVGLGTFVLAGDELTFDAISEARLERAIQLIARRLPDARLTMRQREPLERRPRRAEAPPVGADVFTAEFLAAYLRRWLDEPLQCLESLTPRAAAHTPHLRTEVERLLRTIENRAAHARRDGDPWPDVGWLRHELGIHPQLAA